jgi:hypothetical protein
LRAFHSACGAWQAIAFLTRPRRPKLMARNESCS